MKIIKPGHRYLLDSFEDGEGQVIQFIQKEKMGGKFVTVHDGTTNEEVLAMLIDRLQFLDKKMPSNENKLAIEALGVAATQLRKRTEERKQRGVEGTPAK